MKCETDSIWNPETIAPEKAITQCENLMQDLRFPQC